MRADAGFWRLHRFDSLPSTQDLCRARAQAGEPEGLAVLAGRQTAGRGTQGRSWSTPDGNLALSVLLRPKQPAREVGQWSLLAAVAVTEALVAVLPSTADLSCKWPNDVLLDGAKLAGLLVEAACEGDTIDWLVMGFGVNLATAPQVSGRPTACVADRAPAPEPEVFAPRVLAAIDDWRRVQAQDGFAPVRAAWLRRAPAPGSEVTVRRGGVSFAGRFAGLGEDGALLLAGADGTDRFIAGET